MEPAPRAIHGAAVIFWTPIDARNGFTGECRQIVAGTVQGPMAGLAICRYPNEDSFYLFGCDAAWNCVTDTCHSSLDEAFAQAAFEYSGVAGTWQKSL